MGEVERDLRVKAEDGVLLATDVHHPDGKGPHPTLLQRTPYGKDGFFDWMGIQAYVDAGYRVVFQDCRGGGKSTGEPDFFAEAPDGRATADWIAEQPWFDGRLATFGSSYMGFTQWALASTRPPHLTAMSVGLFGAERRAAWYPGGSFALDIALPWSAARVHGVESMMDPAKQEAVERGFDTLPLSKADEVAVGQTVPWYQDWLAHAEPGDPYWAPLDFTRALDVGVPVLLLDGWYDYQLPNMVRDLMVLQRSGAPTRLVIGPWAHAGTDAEVVNRETIRWFDRHVKGEDVDTGAPASVFVMPDVGWRDLQGWPPPHEPRRWWLQPGGRLDTAVPTGSGATEYSYDPADPTPSFGGASLRLIEPVVDNRELEARDDVLTFTGPELDADLELVGPVTAELHLSSSVEHLDVFLRLCDVEPDGTSWNVADGIRRLTPADIDRAADGTFPVTLRLWPVARRFRAGHRLRLQVSGGAHPLYARNTCSGEPLGEASTIVVAHNAVHHDADHPSALVLPG